MHIRIANILLQILESCVNDVCYEQIIRLSLLNEKFQTLYNLIIQTVLYLIIKPNFTLLLRIVIRCIDILSAIALILSPTYFRIIGIRAIDITNVFRNKNPQS